VLTLLFVYAAASPPEYRRPRSASVIDLPILLKQTVSGLIRPSSSSARSAAAGTRDRRLPPRVTGGRCAPHTAEEMRGSPAAGRTLPPHACRSVQRRRIDSHIWRCLPEAAFGGSLPRQRRPGRRRVTRTAGIPSISFAAR